jgi:hypothetical protein
MLAKLHTFSLLGIDALPVEHEVDVSPGARLRVASLLSNSNARLRNNPKSSGDQLSVQQRDDRRHHLKNVWPTLAADPQYDHTGVSRGRIGTYVGEVQIERDEYTVLCSATLDNHSVARATQSLFVDRVNVVPGSYEQRGQIVV